MPEREVEPDPSADWFEEQPPPPAAPPAGPVAPGSPFDEIKVRAAYVQFLGREANQGEIESHRHNPGGLEAVLDIIKNSPEAKAYAARTPAGSQGPQGGDFKTWFMGLTNGKPPTPATLKSLEAELNKYGITLAPNAAGVVGKIRLPDGRTIDVLQNAGTGGTAWQWLEPGSASTSTAAAPNPTAQFSGPPAPYENTPFTAPPTPTALQTPFTPPTQADLQASPGYAERLAMGVQARQRAAAPMGIRRSGGFQKALERYAQDYASNEYGNLYGQLLTGRQQNVGEFQQTTQNRYGQYLGENQRTLTNFLTNLGARRNYETDFWGRLNDLYQGGLRANL